MVGRPRSEESRQAILHAAVDLLEEVGWAGITIDGLAARAGVGKQTIYRWYGGDLGRIVVDAFVGASDERVTPPDTGSVERDLLAILLPVTRLNRDRDTGTALANRSLMAHAQTSTDFGTQYRALHEHWRAPMLEALRRGVERGELRPDTDADVVVDLLLGFQWYRLLVGHLPSTPASVETGVRAVLDGFATR